MRSTMPIISSRVAIAPGASRWLAQRYREVCVGMGLCAGAIVTGCGESTAPLAVDISVVTLAGEYVPGDTIYIRIENNRSASIALEPCHAILERRDGNSWVLVPESGHSCVDTIRGSTAPGADLTGPAAVIPGSAPSGTYRVTLVNVLLEVGGPPHSVSSATFAVLGL